MKKLLGILLVLLIFLLGIGVMQRQQIQQEEEVVVVEETPTPTPTPSPTPTPEPTPSATPEPDFEDVDSLLLLANKQHPLPKGYEPSDLVTVNVVSASPGLQLRKEAAEALAEMFAAAKEDGVNLVLGSAYRSASYQSQLWNGYESKYGRARADQISSRSGYSDHQTGLAVDLVRGDGTMNGVNYNESFETTAEGTWLREHAHEYGWILRYPKDKEEITGYVYEPWHYRYVGVEYATAIYEVDEFESFEEYFGIEGGKEYKE